MNEKIKTPCISSIFIIYKDWTIQFVKVSRGMFEASHKRRAKCSRTLFPNNGLESNSSAARFTISRNSSFLGPRTSVGPEWNTFPINIVKSHSKQIILIKYLRSTPRSRDQIFASQRMHLRAVIRFRRRDDSSFSILLHLLLLHYCKDNSGHKWFKNQL